MSGATGAILREDPYGDMIRGQRWRGWARFALVWTGMSLAVRRLVRSRRTALGRVQAVSNSPRPRTPVVEPITQAEQG